MEWRDRSLLSDSDLQEIVSTEGEKSDQDKKKIPDELLNVFSYEMIEEPVMAEDGRVYDESSIKDWFSSLQAQGRELVSPHTKKPMGGLLRRDPHAAHRLEP
eukprot:45599-Eustigmatos_ZCMA.PRE.1